MVVVQRQDQPPHACRKEDDVLGAGSGQPREGGHAIAHMLHGAHCAKAHFAHQARSLAANCIQQQVQIGNWHLRPTHREALS